MLLSNHEIINLQCAIFHFIYFSISICIRLFTCSLSQSSGVFVSLTLHLSPNHHHHPLYPLSLSRALLMHLQPWNLFSLKNLLQLECACILSSATLNMQWASPTFSLHVCYGPTPLLCLYEQFLAASFTRTAQNVASLWISKIYTKARIDLKTWDGATTASNRHHQPLKDLNKMEIVRLWSQSAW